MAKKTPAWFIERDKGPKGKGRTCGAKAKGSGKPCKQPAGFGTDHVGYGNCKFHAGSVPAGKHKAAQERAAENMALYGQPREIDPVDALLEELYRTAGHVTWLGMKIKDEATEDDLVQRVGGGDGSIAKAEPGVWLKLYQDERAHLARIAKTCVDVGIDERRVRIAEAQGQLLARAIAGVLEDLGVGLDERVREIVRTRLATIEGHATEVEALPAGST